MFLTDRLGLPFLQAVKPIGSPPAHSAHTGKDLSPRQPYRVLMRKPSAVRVVIPEQIVVQLSHNAGVAPASARSGNILIPASRSPAAACPRRCSPSYW